VYLLYKVLVVITLNEHHSPKPVSNSTRGHLVASCYLLLMELIFSGTLGITATGAPGSSALPYSSDLCIAHKRMGA
jgi:hypothetical protein